MTLARGKRSRKDGAAKEGKPQQFHFRNRYIMATETQAGAPRPPRRPPSAPLRFARGDRVLVPNAHGGLEPGVVRQTRYTEPGWPTGFWVPYQIEREDGAVVYAPEDTDELVRAARSKK